MNKTLDRRNHDESAGDINRRHQRRHKRNLETPARRFHDEPVLGTTGDQIGNLTHSIAVGVSGHESDEVFGPVLVFAQFTTLSGHHVVAPDRLSGNSRVDTGEFEMMTGIGTPNRNYFELAAIDENRFAWFEMNEVILVHIEADVSVETVGATQAPDDETGLSR